MSLTAKNNTFEIEEHTTTQPNHTNLLAPRVSHTIPFAIKSTASLAMSDFDQIVSRKSNYQNSQTSINTEGLTSDDRTQR